MISVRPWSTAASTGVRPSTLRASVSAPRATASRAAARSPRLMASNSAALGARFWVGSPGMGSGARLPWRPGRGAGGRRVAGGWSARGQEVGPPLLEGQELAVVGLVGAHRRAERLHEVALAPADEGRHPLFQRRSYGAAANGRGRRQGTRRNE